MLAVVGKGFKSLDALRTSAHPMRVGSVACAMGDLTPSALGMGIQGRRMRFLRHRILRGLSS